MSTPQYICHNNTCAIAISKATFPSGMNCPVCKEPLKEVLENNQTVQHSDHEQMIVDNYPYVIAYPFSKMLLETHPLAKINLLKDTLQNTLKYVALLLATEYFESQLKSDSINALFKDNLQRPSFGNWNHFIRETLKELHKEEQAFFIKELPEFYKKIEVDGAKKYKIVRKVTNDLGLEENVKSSLTAIEALINFRNKEIGHGVTWPDKKNKELYETYYPILRDVLVAMNFVVHYPMYKYDKGSKWELTGTSISIFDTAETVNHKDTKHLWVENKNGEALFLAPFFILPKSYITDVPDEVEVFVYEEYTGSRLIFFSPESAKGETSGAILRELQLLLENKISENAYTKETLNVTLITDQITKQNDRVLKELHTERKVLPGIYQERQDAEVALRSWIGSIYGLFMVSATAGSGKTNLMVEMQSQYEQRNLSAVLFRANRIKSTNIELVLKKTLDLDVSYDFNDLKALGFNQKNPLIVLIDGGNEHNTPDVFLQGVLQLLKKHTGGFIKVVLSWRADLKNELPVVEDTYENLVYTEKEDSAQTHLLAKKAFTLTPLNKKELEAAWVLYTKNKSKTFKPKFTIEELTYFDRKLTDDLHNPLHLKLFLELFHNKGLPKTQGFFNLWEAYSKQLKKHKEQYTLLLLLIELMFDKQMHALPSALVYEHPSISTYIHNKDISGPYEQLKRKGILAEYYQDNERYIAFAVEALYHHLLGAFLSKKLIGAPNSTLLELLSTQQLKGIKEGVQQLLLLDINQQDFSRLLWLIDHSKQEQLLYYALPLANAFIQFDVLQVFDKLFETPTDNDVFVLYNSLIIINTAGKNSLYQEVYRFANLHIEPKCFYGFLIKIESIKHLKANDESLDERLTLIKNNSIKKGIELDDFEAEVLDYILGEAIFEDNEGNESNIEISTPELSATELVFKKEEQLEKIESLIKNSEFNDLEKSIIYESLSSVYSLLGNKELTLSSLNKGLEFKKIYYSDNHPILWKIYNDIGMFYHDILNFDKGLKFYKKALNIINNEAKISLAHIYNNLGSIYTEIGNINLGMEYLQKSLNINLNFFGKEHEIIATCYNNFGLNFEEQKMYEEALIHYNDSLHILLKLFKEDENENIATLYDHIGVINIRLENYEDGLDLLNKGLSIRKKKFGYIHPDIAYSYRNLGFAYEKIGEHDKAIELYKDCIHLLKTLSNNPAQVLLIPKNKYQIYLSYKEIGDIQKRTKNYSEALKNYYEALDVLTNLPDHNSDYVKLYNCLGTTYLLLGDIENGFEFYNKAAKLLLKQNNIKDLVSFTRGRFMVLNRPKDALHWLEQAALAREDDLGLTHESTQNTITELVVYAKEHDELKMVEQWEQKIKV